ncbi:MAG: glutamate formimidoyltransferase [Nitrospiraceae bacterium]
MNSLIECVPNFSEGRDPAVVQAFVDAVTSVPEVWLLHRTSDSDHHRSVLTFAGAPDAVGEAAYRAVAVAAKRIDLRTHRGEHPRVGATDVVPFVPLQGSTMADCIVVAESVAARIGRDLAVPTFLYEAAAKHPDRSRLEVIRRGGLAGLADRMARDSAWRPDFGPPNPHPTAGVTVVGARKLLVAFNVNLDSQDLTAAQAIAKTIRASGGGLPGVKALGLLLASRSQVQVSMNLVDLDRTPLHEAVAAVRREATARGIAVADGELIGLIPQHAVAAAAQAGLSLRQLEAGQILESQLSTAQRASPRISDQTVGALLRAVGAHEPIPAGAAVCATGGALAAQLAAKVLRVIAARTAGDPSPTMQKQIATLDSCAWALLEAADRDAEVYRAYLDVRRATKGADVADADRMARREAALVAATHPPVMMFETFVTILGVLQAASIDRKQSVRADWDAAMQMVRACMVGVKTLVDNNLNSVHNQSLKTSLVSRVRESESCLEGFGSLC